MIVVFVMVVIKTRIVLVFVMVNLILMNVAHVMQMHQMIVFKIALENGAVHW